MSPFHTPGTQGTWKNIVAQKFKRTLLYSIVLASLFSASQASAGSVSATAPKTPVGKWLKGDLHVHDDHSSDGSFLRQGIDQGAPGDNSVADQIGQAERNGLDFVPLTDHRTYTQQYDPLWESSKLLLIPGEEANGSPHALVHGAVDSIVQGANPAGQPGFVNLQQSIWDAHSQDASWGTAHPDDGEIDADGLPNVSANAQGVDLVEAWNRASTPDLELDYAEDRWNHGFRFGLSGGSDDHFKELWAIDSPGMPTTQVFAAGNSERAVIGGLRAGHTSVSLTALSPFVTLEADMQKDGDFSSIGGDESFAPVGTKGQLRIHVTNAAGSTVILYKSPGRSAGAMQTFSPTLADETYLVDVAVGFDPAWYRVEVRGVDGPSGIEAGNLRDPDYIKAMTLAVPDQLRAISSPIFISTGPVEATPAIPLPADSGAPDGADLAIGAQGLFTGFPDIAVDAGTTHVVAESHDETSTRIFYRSRRANGAWSDSNFISGISTTARFPKLAVHGSDVWVTWQDERAGQIPRRPAIYLRHSADSGKTWNAEQLVRQIDGRSEHPVITLTRDGLPLLAWQEISTGHAFDIYAETIGRDSTPTNLSGPGKIIAAASAVDTRSARYPASIWPSLAVARDGRVAIAWQDDRTDIDPLWTGSSPSGNGTDPDNWQIMVATLPGKATAWTAPVSLGSDTLSDRHPALAFDADNALIVAWDSKALSSSGANLSVLSARSTDGGTIFSAPAAISPAASAMSQFPHMGVEPDGRVRAVWYDSRSADWRWRVATAVMGTDGAWSAGEVINSPGNNTWPATSGGVIAMASTRNALRMQRDHTQEIYLAKPPSVAAPVAGKTPAE